MVRRISRWRGRPAAWPAGWLVLLDIGAQPRLDRRIVGQHHADQRLGAQRAIVCSVAESPVNDFTAHAAMAAATTPAASTGITILELRFMDLRVGARLTGPH